jgi:hypothetical protein
VEAADDIVSAEVITQKRHNKRSVVLVTKSPPGWFMEKNLRSHCGKKQPLIPASSCCQKNDEGETKKQSTVLVGSPPGWIWAKLLQSNNR